MSDPKLITARRKYGAAAIVVYLQLLVMAYRDKGYYLAYGDSDRDGVIWSIKSEVLSGRYEPDAEKIAEMIYFGYTMKYGMGLPTSTEAKRAAAS